MAMTDGRRNALARLREAEEAANDLREQLRKSAVVLPSLRIDPVSAAGSEPSPLIDLGRCNLETVRRLVVVLRQREGL
ncbi:MULTISPECIES: hypothetical protein [unclassified Streptomyces]|uniref:hypothetical protein n=1 Tax=unclassified Streptomyces TaxID=2593676 RepID=UPI0022B718FC|nr:MULTISPECIES: hypothetical protein [unclassified Streptomyces]MCZ7417767.1 hypothetical protein [Streptomyces sp. WMMC897]MCZ7432437.1 hypothetical protein [Streptomyces sp. WMMC1477]